MFRLSVALESFLILLALGLILVPIQFCIGFIHDRIQHGKPKYFKGLVTDVKRKKRKRYGERYYINVYYIDFDLDGEHHEHVEVGTNERIKVGDEYLFFYNWDGTIYKKITFAENLLALAGGYLLYVIFLVIALIRFPILL